MGAVSASFREALRCLEAQFRACGRRPLLSLTKLELCTPLERAWTPCRVYKLNELHGVRRKRQQSLERGDNDNALSCSRFWEDSKGGRVLLLWGSKG